MKRLFVGVACAALLVPSLASGSSATSVTSAAGHAKRGDEFAIQFTVILRRGKPRKIKKLTFQNALAQCETGGNVDFEFPPPGLGPYKVNKRRRFGRKFPVVWATDTMARRGTANGSVAVKGRFNRRVSRVRGTLRAKGSPEGSTGCDTGRIRWVARIR